MSWIPLIRDQVALAFNLLDDLVDDIIWNKRTDPQFVDGAYTYTELKKNVGGVKSKYNAKLIDGDNIQSIDRELLIRQAQVPIVGENDQFTVEGKVYNVQDFDKDTANVTWTVQLRPA